MLILDFFRFCVICSSGVPRALRPSFVFLTLQGRRKLIQVRFFYIQSNSPYFHSIPIHTYAKLVFPPLW